MQSEGNAKFRVNFKPTEAQPHLISVKFNNEPVPSSPFECAVRATSTTSGSGIMVTGPGVKMTAVNKITSLVINAPPDIAKLYDVEVTSPTNEKVEILKEKDEDYEDDAEVSEEDDEDDEDDDEATTNDDLVKTMKTHLIDDLDDFGIWNDEEAMVAARPEMIAFLDTMRHLLSEISPELGVTDPVSGEVIFLDGIDWRSGTLSEYLTEEYDFNEPPEFDE